MGDQRFFTISGKDGAAILAALTLADDDSAMIEIDVLHPELDTFTDPEPGAVAETGHEFVPAAKMGHDTFDLADGQYGGHKDGAASAGKLSDIPQRHLKNMGVDKDQGIERLVLGDGRIVLAGQMFEELPDVGGAQEPGSSSVVEEIVFAGPKRVGLEGAFAEIADVTGVPKSLDE